MWPLRKLAGRFCASFAASLLLFGSGHAAVMAQGVSANPSPSPVKISARLHEDLNNLQQPNTTDDAYKDLLSLAESDRTTVSVLAAKLPLIIDNGPPNGTTKWENADEISTWENAVRLAGQLKITEACAALGRWIDVWDSQEFTNSRVFSLRIIPAAKALSQIGEPAIPTLISILNTGDENKRWPAAVALDIIHSPAAMNALCDRLAHETDPHVKAYITSAMKRYRAEARP